MIKTAFKPFKPDVLKEYIYAFGNFIEHWEGLGETRLHKTQTPWQHPEDVWRRPQGDDIKILTITGLVLTHAGTFLANKWQASRSEIISLLFVAAFAYILTDTLTATLSVLTTYWMIHFEYISNKHFVKLRAKRESKVKTRPWDRVCNGLIHPPP